MGYVADPSARCFFILDVWLRCQTCIASASLAQRNGSWVVKCPRKKNFSIERLSQGHGFQILSRSFPDPNWNIFPALVDGLL
eukprot:s1061_g23.t1